MKDNEVLRVYLEDDGTPMAEYKADRTSMEKIILALSGAAANEFLDKHQQRGGMVDILLATVVHFLAQEESGRLERDFIKNVKMNVPKYRKEYAQIADQMRAMMSAKDKPAN